MTHYGPALLALLLWGAQGDGKVDLLKLLDLKKDAVAGDWKLDGGKLVSPGLTFARVQVPYVPPREYDLTVVAEREEDPNSVAVGLAVGEQQFLAILEGKRDSEFRSGLDMVGGKPFYDNETTVKGRLLPDRGTFRIVCSVREKRVTVAVDGKKAIDWPADPKKLSLFKDWKLPRRDTLFLGSWSNVVTFHRLELTPVTGEGKPLR